MTERRHALAFNSLSRALQAAGHWIPLSARRTAAEAVLCAVDTDGRPPEHCGHQPDLYGHSTECVLRPGHSGSHTDRTGMRWWKRQITQGPAAPARHTVDTLTSDALDRLYAELDLAREEAGKAAWQRDRLGAFLVTACRASGAATYADVPEAVHGLVEEVAAAKETALALGALADEWFVASAHGEKRECGRALAGVLLAAADARTARAARSGRASS
ncbi:hypothetical protein ACFVU3_07995 [Streptomyces sp. NPDC058052]|uniref:hypothetical protein n=1 Tax=Streptomyces sp. NPDC058052 TaxID=3346316 RepID=UPI0036EFD85D